MGYRPKLLSLRHTTHKVNFVEVACVAGAWKYLGSRKTRRARGLLGTRSLSSRVSPSRVPFFLAGPLLPSACYAGYVEVALSSNFIVFPRRHYFCLVPKQGNSHTCPQPVGKVAPAPLKYEKLGLICEPLTSNHASYST